MYQFTRVLKMDLTNLLTNPMWWTGTIGLPLMLTLIMGFITKGIYGDVVTSYDYFGITMLVFGALNSATLAANSFMETRILKANMRLCSAPIASFSIYFPKIIATVVFGMLCHTLTAVALHIIVGVNFGGINALFLWVLLLAISFFAAVMGVMLCCILKNEETVNQFLSNLVSLICLFGGTFFSLKGFGFWGNLISNISPVTWVNAAAFGAIYDHKLTILGYTCTGLVIASLLGVGISAKCFNREDYL